MKPILTAAVAALCMALSGCGIYGGIVEGSTQGIKIETPPTTGAICVLTNTKINTTAMSPNIVYVERTREALNVHCKKPGWNDGNLVIPADKNGWGYGDIVPDLVSKDGAINIQPNTFNVPMTQEEGKQPSASPNKSSNGLGG